MRGERIPESHNLRVITTRPFTPNTSQPHIMKSNKKNKGFEISAGHKFSSSNSNKVIFGSGSNNLYANKNILNFRYNNDMFYENQKISDDVNLNKEE